MFWPNTWRSIAMIFVETVTGLAGITYTAVVRMGEEVCLMVELGLYMCRSRPEDGDEFMISSSSPSSSSDLNEWVDSELIKCLGGANRLFRRETDTTDKALFLGLRNWSSVSSSYTDT